MGNNKQLAPSINGYFIFLIIFCAIFYSLVIFKYRNGLKRIYQLISLSIYKIFQSINLIYTSNSSIDQSYSIKQSNESCVIQYHSPSECTSCVILQSIPTADMTRLQHHYKFCAIYSLYYRVMTALKLKLKGTKKTSKLELRIHYIYVPKEAQELCESLSTMEDKWDKIFPVSTSDKKLLTVRLFGKVGEMSKQLIGPTQTKEFDCDRYKEYLQCLQQIAIGIGADEVLLADLHTYLDPYLGDEKWSWTRNSDQEWKKTFALLRHSEKDDDFGDNLKKIATKNSFLFSKEYTYKCHKF